MSEEEQYGYDNSHQHSENIENAEELADQAGETVFRNIYKNVKNEIKDNIITKLLNKIERQEIKIQNLESENKKLKEDYTYTLKRIILTKNELTPYNQINNISNKYNTNEFNSRNIGSNLGHKKMKTINEDNYDTFDTTNDSDKQGLDYKVKKYLNNLCKKNASNSTEGTSTSHYIGKPISIYDELFPKNNIGTNSDFMGSDLCHCYAGASTKDLKRNKSNQNRKPKIRLEIREYRNEAEDYNNEESKRNKNTKNKTYNRNKDSTVNKRVLNKSQEKSKTDEKIRKSNKKTKVYSQKGNVINSNDPNRLLKLKYGSGTSGNKKTYSNNKYGFK